MDPLVPELRTNLHILNDVFADPKIVKILHGADSDIIWLQRDFGLYVVNLFDTFFASKALQRKGHSLASLLVQYTTFSPDKRYQLADWRIRPLTDEMLKYARSDTHFLIHIYECLRRDVLMTGEMLAEVRRKSAEVAKQAYEHLGYDLESGYGQGGWRKLIERAGKAPLWGLEEVAGQPPGQKWINAQGVIALEVFKVVHDWRDRLARELDEGIGFILPNRAIFAVAERPPKDEASLAKALENNYTGHIQERKEELLSLILKAIDRGAIRSEALRLEAASAPPAAPVASLWESTGPAQQSGSSTLLEPRAVSSAKSTLFGPLTSMPANNAAFNSILAKVHADILGPLAASIPIPEEEPDREPASADDPAKVQDGSAIHVLDIESPVASRNGSATPKAEAAGWEDDDIVSVTGRKKVKGNKRKQPEVADALPKPEIEPYDFSKTKSVLDAPRPAKEEFDPRRSKKQKKEKKGGGGAVVDSFKSAPKSMNMPKSGNKSHTFT